MSPAVSVSAFKTLMCKWLRCFILISRCELLVASWDVFVGEAGALLHHDTCRELCKTCTSVAFGTENRISRLIRLEDPRSVDSRTTWADIGPWWSGSRPVLDRFGRGWSGIGPPWAAIGVAFGIGRKLLMVGPGKEVAHALQQGLDAEGAG